DLLERIKGIECIGRNTSLEMGGGVRRFRAGGDGRVWWNGDGGLTFGLEITGRRGCRLVMRFHVLVISVRVEHHLIPEDFVISGEITAIALALGEGGGEQIEVKPRSLTAKCSDAASAVEIAVGRS